MLPVVLALAEAGLIVFLVGVAVLCLLDLVYTVCTVMKVWKVIVKTLKPLPENLPLPLQKIIGCMLVHCFSNSCERLILKVSVHCVIWQRR